MQAFFTWLRAEHPIARVEAEGYRPFWVVTRHADIREIERQPAIFNAGPRNTLLPIAAEEANMALFGVEAGFETLVVLDGERHYELRQMTQDYFLPKNVRRLEGMVDNLAAAFVDRLMATGGRCDIAADIVFWYPLRVAMTVLGIDEANEARMLKLTHELFGASDPAVRRPGMSLVEHSIAVKRDYIAFFDEITQDRRANPRDDVSTIIARGLPNEHDLSPEERLGYYVIVATAGHDTTAASIAAGIQALIDQPDFIAALREDPALVKSFANEAIRFCAPVKHFFRNVTAEYTLGDVTFRPGDHIMLHYGAATRDEAVFPDAQTFRIDRTPNNHLAFGYGPHQCLGQFLAKMEIEAFFRALVRRVDRIEADGAPAYTQATFVTGLRGLPVRCSFASVA
ncbi:cytochrome P450 [Novosphingobium cyanobacteriorum]|uniref:Cytochrome P450 n=1 Tax=Novosphingobium cyanobacteriorum TaxID=3024215 RepID=A0ABT6CK56_9SPHN|nr:cytochrome P450 [Novosphingobium cyanobacteriorum]MDF8334314.1 cytochrome P450 [Novosphingobium cyanobacteriorum]